MGNQFKVVNTHQTGDQETADIVAVDVGVDTTTTVEITVTDQDLKVQVKKKVTTRMTKTDLRLMNDLEDLTEVVAVDEEEDVAVDAVIQDVEDIFDEAVMMTVKDQNTHKTVTVKEKMVNDVKIVIDDHDDSADVHDVHHRAPETKVIAIEVNKKNAEIVTTNVEAVADAVDAQDVTSVHESQKLKGMPLRAANQNAKINLQMTPHPPPLKLEEIRVFFSSTLRCFVYLLIATLRTFSFIEDKGDFPTCLEK